MTIGDALTWFVGDGQYYVMQYYINDNDDNADNFLIWSCHLVAKKWWNASYDDKTMTHCEDDNDKMMMMLVMPSVARMSCSIRLEKTKYLLVLCLQH